MSEFNDYPEITEEIEQTTPELTEELDSSEQEVTEEVLSAENQAKRAELAADAAEAALAQIEAEGGNIHSLMNRMTALEGSMDQVETDFGTLQGTVEAESARITQNADDIDALQDSMSAMITENTDGLMLTPFST